MKPWIAAIRPKTLFISAGPVFLGAAVAIHYCQFSLPIFLCILIAAMAIQVGSHFVNDYYDFLKGTDTEQRVGPAKAISSGLITLEQMRMATIVAFAVALIFSIPLILVGGKVIAFTLAISIFLAVLYTATPISLSYTGMADIACFIMYGPVPVLLTTYLLTGFYSKFAFLIGLAPGAIATAILAVANLRDMHTDGKSGKNTLAVRFGERFIKFQYGALIIGASLVPLLVYYEMWLRYRFLLSLYMILPGISLIKHLYKLRSAEEYAGMLPLTLQFFVCDFILLGIACLT